MLIINAPTTSRKRQVAPNGSVSATRVKKLRRAKSVDLQTYDFPKRASEAMATADRLMAEMEHILAFTGVPKPAPKPEVKKLVNVASTSYKQKLAREMTFEQAVGHVGGPQINACIGTWSEWTFPNCGVCGASCGGGLQCGIESKKFQVTAIDGLTCMECFMKKGQLVVTESMRMAIEKTLKSASNEEWEVEYWTAVKIVFERNGVKINIPKNYTQLIGTITAALAVA